VGQAPVALRVATLAELVLRPLVTSPPAIRAIPLTQVAMVPPAATAVLVAIRVAPVRAMLPVGTPRQRQVVTQAVVLVMPPVELVPPGRAEPDLVAIAQAVPHPTLLPVHPVVRAVRVRAVPELVLLAVPATAAPVVLLRQVTRPVVLVLALLVRAIRRVTRVAVPAVPGAAAPVVMRPRLLRRVAPETVLRRAAVVQRAVTAVRVVLRPRVMVAQVRAVLELLVRAVPELAGQVAPATQPVEQVLQARVVRVVP